MARLDVAPTRRNFLDVQKSLERTREGYELLEEKRQILVIELMSTVEAAKRIKEEIVTTMAAAYSALSRAAVRSGITGLMRQCCGVRLEHSLALQTRSVMGVQVPQIECRPAEVSVQFSLTDGRSQTDEVMRRFLEALRLAAELAEVENAVLRLAREIRRTQRRVNALEKTYIPLYENTLSFIEEALAERQREQFIVLRRVKRRREAARRVAEPTRGHSGPEGG